MFPQDLKDKFYEWKNDTISIKKSHFEKLAKEGHRTRVYIPYGSRWYEYSMRRLRENPDVAWHVAKSIIMPWTNRRYSSHILSSVFFRIVWRMEINSPKVNCGPLTSKGSTLTCMQCANSPTHSFYFHNRTT